MKRFCFILLCTMLVTVLARAQENKPVTEAGATSLNFTFGGFGGFGADGAYVAGGRYVRPLYGLGLTFYVADNVGLRVGVATNLNSETTPRPDPVEDEVETQLAVGVSPAVVIHLLNSGPGTLYTGVAFSVGTTFSWFGSEEQRTVQSRYSYGGGLLLGAEFYPVEFLSIGAESQLGIELGTTSTKVDKETTDGPTTTTIGFMLPVRVNLSFHI